MKKTVPPASPDAYVQALSDWRKPLVERLPGGEYEMATIVLHEGDTIAPAAAKALVQAAIERNGTLGDPTSVAKG